MLHLHNQSTNQSTTHFYTAFGLTIKSELLLPELVHCKDNVFQDRDIITITFKDLTELKNTYLKPNQYFYVSKDFCLFYIPDVAIFSIRFGIEITVSPYEDASLDQIRLYVLGTCMGAVLIQRNILPLHGSAIVLNNKAFAIVGHSGAGKSTLASAFLRKGALLMSDDVIPIKFNDTNEPIIIPAYPQQKLWIESLNRFEVDHSDFQPIFNRESKYKIPVIEQFHNQPIVLSGIIELIKTENEEMSFSKIDNLQQFPLLYEHTYRNFFLDGMGLLGWHFTESAKIAKKVPIYQLKRPQTHFSAFKLVDIITSVMEIEKITIN